MYDTIEIYEHAQLTLRQVQAEASCTKVLLFSILCGLFSVESVYAFDGNDVRQSFYFDAGYTYHLILCFLAGIHGIIMSIRTLKRLLRRMNLRRRGLHNSHRTVCQCIMVSYCSV